MASGRVLYCMKISSIENIELHDKLFKDWDNYDKWAPFLKEFQQQYKDKCKGLPAGLLGVDILFVNDEMKDEFMTWVNHKVKLNQKNETV